MFTRSGTFVILAVQDVPQIGIDACGVARRCDATKSERNRDEMREGKATIHVFRIVIRRVEWSLDWALKKTCGAVGRSGICVDADSSKQLHVFIVVFWGEDWLMNGAP